MDGYLKDTLHGILNCRCNGNCLLKSLQVNEIAGETAYINAEPYDDAFNQSNVDETIERIKRTLLRRKRKIHEVMNVASLSVTVYDEWTLKDAFIVDFHSHKITSSVN